MRFDLKKLLTAMRVSLRWITPENIAQIKSQFEQADPAYRPQFAKAIEKLLKHKVLIDATTLPFLTTLFSEQSPEDYARSLVYLKKANLLTLENFERFKQRQAPISSLLHKLSSKSTLTAEIFEACVTHSQNLCGTPTLRNQYLKILNATKVNAIFADLIALSTEYNRLKLSSFEAQEKILNFLQQYDKTTTEKPCPQASQALKIEASTVEPQFSAISDDGQEFFDDYFETFMMSQVNEGLPAFSLDESEETSLLSDLELSLDNTQSMLQEQCTYAVVSGAEVFWGALESHRSKRSLDSMPLESRVDTQLEETAPKRHKTEAINLEEMSGVPALLSFGLFSLAEYIDADDLAATLPLDETQP